MNYEERINELNESLSYLENEKNSLISSAVLGGLYKNRKFKDSGLSWVSKIPENWDVLPNKYIMHKSKEIKETYEGEPILSLTIAGVIKRDLDNPSGKMPTSFNGYQKVYAGNLLMCLFDIDVTPRCIGIIKENGLTSPSYSQYVMHSNARADYFYYYYLMMDHEKRLLHLAKNLRHSLNEEQFDVIKTIVPPIEEQREIAKYLDKKCAEIDDVIGDIKAQIETLKQTKKSIISQSVYQGLKCDIELKDSGISWVGMIPAHWRVSRAKYLFTNDKQVVGKDVDNYERLALTMNGVIKRSKDDNNGLQPEKFDTYQILRKNELVFKLIDLQNVTTSRVGLSPYTGIVSPAYIILKSNGQIEPSYAEKYYLSMWMNEIFNYLGDAGVRSSLNATELLEIALPVPPIEEQREIAKYLDKKCAEIDDVIGDKEKQLDVLEEYKKSLIFEIVTGKRGICNE